MYREIINIGGERKEEKGQINLLRLIIWSIVARTY